MLFEQTYWRQCNIMDKCLCKLLRKDKVLKQTVFLKGKISCQ